MTPAITESEIQAAKERMAEKWASDAQDATLYSDMNNSYQRGFMDAAPIFLLLGEAKTWRSIYGEDSPAAKVAEEKARKLME